MNFEFRIAELEPIRPQSNVLISFAGLWDGGLWNRNRRKDLEEISSSRLREEMGCRLEKTRLKPVL